LLYNRSAGFFPLEAEHPVAIARPVAALLTYLPLLAVNSLADYRWTRIISTLSFCFLGFQMIAICVHLLSTQVWDAVIVALA
jgi:hypothetical protein